MKGQRPEVFTRAGTDDFQAGRSGVRIAKMMRLILIKILDAINTLDYLVRYVLDSPVRSKGGFSVFK